MLVADLDIAVSVSQQRRTNDMTTTKALTPMEDVRGTLQRMQPEFMAALPAQIPVDKFVRTTLTAIQMNPALLNADRRSLLGSCMKAAQDGLLCDGREAALVMFKNTVQYMPMYAGILKKIRNSGELATISAQVVYDKDQFDYTLGDEERISHKPFLGADRGKPIVVYAIAKTKDGAIYREVMSVAEIEKVRAVSRASGNGPWVQWWDEMAKKTVIRRLAKRLPSSADVDQVFDHDNEATGITEQPQQAAVSDAPVSGTAPKQISRLKRSIAEQTEVLDAIEMVKTEDLIDPVTGEVLEVTDVEVVNDKATV
jgi:recombination protein RecT